MAVSSVASQHDSSPPVPPRTLRWFWAFAFVGAPILAVACFAGLASGMPNDPAPALLGVAVLAAAVFWLVERCTEVTAPMALGGWLVTAVMSIPWAYAAFFVAVVTGLVDLS